MDCKILYLPIEIKHREYTAQILLAASAAIRGYRVYLGTHAAIFALLKCKQVPSGIILEKGMPSLARLKWLRQKCSEIWVLDAEISPIHTKEVLVTELPSRLYEGGVKEIDRYLVVGDMACEAAQEYFGLGSKKVVMTGWPRLDIARLHGFAFHADEIAAINEKHGDFLLFASGFAVNRDPREISHLKKATIYNRTPFWEQTAMQERYEKFLHTVECLRKWDADPRVPAIVVRPHAGESMSVWRKSLSGLSKTRLEGKGNPIAWINASSGVIHQGSTIAIESMLANKVSYFFAEGALERYSSISDMVSALIVSKDSPPLMPKFRSKESNNPRYSPKVLRSVVHYDEQTAISKILDEMDEIPPTKFCRISRVKLILSQVNFKGLRRFAGLIRDEVYWKLGLLNIHPQSVSVPGGLNKQEIERIIKSTLEFSSVSFTRQTINLWEFAGGKN